MSKCPHCNAETFKSPFVAYCMKCGKPLEYNTCQDSQCVIHSLKVELPSDAIFCPFCGKQTTFSIKEPF